MDHHFVSFDHAGIISNVRDKKEENRFILLTM